MAFDLSDCRDDGEDIGAGLLDISEVSAMQDTFSCGMDLFDSLAPSSFSRYYMVLST